MIFRYRYIPQFPWVSVLEWTVSDCDLTLLTDKTLATYIWIDATGQVIIRASVDALSESR